MSTASKFPNHCFFNGGSWQKARIGGTPLMPVLTNLLHHNHPKRRLKRRKKYSDVFIQVMISKLMQNLMRCLERLDKISLTTLISQKQSKSLTAQLSLQEWVACCRLSKCCLIDIYLLKAAGWIRLLRYIR